MKILTLTALNHFQYGVGCTFAEQLHRGFEKLGHEAMIYDLSPADAVKKLPAFLNECSPDLVVSMGASGADFKLGDKFLFANIPFVGFLIDHPAAIHNRLKELPNKVALTIVEPLHKNFIETFCDQKIKTFFLPHAASKLAKSGTTTSVRRDIVFCGSGAEAQELISWANKSLPPELAKAFFDLSEQVLISGDFDYSKYFSIFQGLLQAPFLAMLVNNCDILVRRTLRYHYLDILDKAGIAVDIFGNNWPQQRFKNHRIHAAVTHNEALNIMDNSQLSLCIADSNPLGSHERVFDEMLRGNICVTTQSKFWQENFVDGEDYFGFDYRNEQQFIDAIQKALKVDKTPEQRVSTVTKMNAQHLWFHRAKTIVDEIYPKLK